MNDRRKLVVTPVPPPDLSTLFEGRRVHRLAYTDHSVFRLEMDNIFGGTWVFLAHESQLPEPNDYLTVPIGGRSVIVTHGVDGNYHALLNRCMHRGVELCTTTTGNAKRFTCAYHGWTYANDGRCVGVPFPGPYGSDFRREEFNLGAMARIDVCEGLVFGSFNPDVLPLREHLGAAADVLREWRMRAPGGRIEARANARRIAISGNWKLCWDNAADGYHAAFVHESLVSMTNERHGDGKSLSHFDNDPDKLPMVSHDFGRGHQFLDQRPSIADDRWAHARPVPGRDELVAALHRDHSAEDVKRWLDLVPGAAMNISIFPNLFISGNLIATCEPIAPGRTHMTEYATTYPAVPDEVNQLRLRFAEDFVNFGEPDDIEMWERTQRGLEIGEIEWLEVSRGAGLPADQLRDGNGVATIPISWETPLRGYLTEWQKLLAR